MYSKLSTIALVAALICIVISLAFYATIQQEHSSDTGAQLATAAEVYSLPPSPNITPVACTNQHGTDIDVTDFGAIPDDGYRDGAAVKAAFDCLFHNAQNTPHKSGRLYFPAGEYHMGEQRLWRENIEESIYRDQGIHIEGAGESDTIIHYSGDADFIRLTYDSNSYGVKLSNMTVLATRPVSGSALHVAGPDRGITVHPNLTVRDIRIGGYSHHDYFMTGIRAYATKRNYLKDVTISGATHNRVGMRTCFEMEDAYGVSIEYSACSYADIGIKQYSDKLGGTKGPEGGNFLDNTITNTNIGVYVKTFAQEPGLTIMDSTIRAYQHAILIDGRRFARIDGNKITPASGIGSDYTDIELNAVEFSQVTNNQFLRHHTLTAPHVTLNDMATPMVNGNTPIRPSVQNIVELNSFSNTENRVVESGDSTGQNVIRDNT